MEKRKLFIWKEAHEKLLISEVLQDEPYEFKEGSKERGACWTRISERLTQAGIEAEYGEVDQALQDISERMDEMEEERENEKKKVKKERANAEDMRKKAAETLSQTKKRKISGADEVDGGYECDSDPDKDSDISPNKKKRRNASVTDIMTASLEAKKQEKVKEQELRERELELKHAEQESQRSYQQRMLEQQSSFMQQQAMNMAMVNAINEMVKKFRH